eukprot:2193164-Amphidinium_carterae.1
MSELGQFPLEEMVRIDPDYFKTLMPEWGHYVAKGPRLSLKGSLVEGAFVKKHLTHHEHTRLVMRVALRQCRQRCRHSDPHGEQLSARALSRAISSPTCVQSYPEASEHPRYAEAIPQHKRLVGVSWGFRVSFSAARHQNIWVEGSLRDAEWFARVFRDIRERFPKYSIGIVHVQASEVPLTFTGNTTTGDIAVPIFKLLVTR